MTKIRFGVLGVAKIATEKVIPAMQQGTQTEVSAIASRSLKKAQTAAKKLNIVRAYGSYEALLADSDIDAIYNPLPNHLHVAWSIKALAAGKHVLCEKPIGLSSEEGEQLVAAAQEYPNLKLMEAFMYRHHPQWQAAKRIVKEGRIGQLRTIQSFFSYFNDDPNNIRNQADIGGGSMMDIGCYPISVSRFIFARQPRRVQSWIERDESFGIDRLASVALDFGDGTSTFTCGTQLANYQRVNIFGTTGRVEIEIPFNAPPNVPCKIWHHSSVGIEEIIFDVCDQYTIQGDLFARAIQDDTPVPTPITDAVENMQVIEAVMRAGESGGWEDV